MSLRARAANARYIARHPVQTFRGSPAVTGMHNQRSKRAFERGRASRLSGVSAAISSRTPFYRDRINRSTGRKNRDNRFMHRTRNEGLARMKTSTAGAEQIREHTRTRSQAFRNGDIGAANAAHERWYRSYASASPAVRERYGSLVAARQPQERPARTRRLGRRTR